MLENIIKDINNFEIKIVEFIQNVFKSDWFTILMRIITHFGDRFIFVLIIAFVYWGVNKKYAYKLFAMFIGSAIVNTMIKFVIKRPRPFKINKNLGIGVESHGFSFPSGHSQTIAVLSFGTVYNYKKMPKLLKLFFLSFLIMVPFSRIYLGQHYLSDVIIGLVVGIIFTIMFSFFFDLLGNYEDILPLLGIPLIILIVLNFKNADFEKFENIFITCGGYIGFTLGYFLEKKFIKHDVNDTLMRRFKKIFFGSCSAIIILISLDLTLNKNSLMSLFYQYLIVSFYVILIAPFIFKIVFNNKKQ